MVGGVCGFLDVWFLKHMPLGAKSVQHQVELGREKFRRLPASQDCQICTSDYTEPRFYRLTFTLWPQYMHAQENKKLTTVGYKFNHNPLDFMNGFPCKVQAVHADELTLRDPQFMTQFQIVSPGFQPRLANDLVAYI